MVIGEGSSGAGVCVVVVHMASAPPTSHWASRGYVVATGLLASHIDRVARMVDEVATLDPAGERAPLHVFEEHPQTAAVILSRTEDFSPSHRGLDRLLRNGSLRRLVEAVAGEPVTLFKDKINYKLPGGAGCMLCPCLNRRLAAVTLR